MTFLRYRLSAGMLSTIGLLAVACTNESTTSQKDPILVETDTVQQTVEGTQLHFPLELTNETIDQVYDETRDQPLSAERIKKLGLEMIESTEGGCTFYDLGELNFSTTFDTRLILWTSSWSQWMMWLVTYNSENKMLDFTLVLAGDSVEYYSETFSTITKEHIEVTTITYDYSGEEEKSETEKTHLTLDEKGFFQFE